MLTVNVDLGDRSYPIAIGAGLFGDKAFAEHVDQALLRQGKIVIVTNDVVAPLYLEKAKSFFAGRDCAEVVLADGEANKTLGAVDSIYEFLLSNKYDRHTTLVALGGGVVGDITGFAAATYLRGIDFVQIPTTLLAQVDSSVGGKTGVNHPLGKNMIGAFYQPRCVIADTDVLSTLPSREIRAGLAEVIKYGLIRDPRFFHWLGEHSAQLVNCDPALMAEVIQTCCRVKAEIVAEDERESGVRALLNLGHTFGHAIETAAGYGTWLHGETVAMGTVMAADLSARIGWIDADDARLVRRILEENFGMTVVPPADITIERYLDLMASDKKTEQGKLRFILLKAIGQGAIASDIEPGQLVATLEAGDRLCE
jgi:3-dehydroquinate synthase